MDFLFELLFSWWWWGKDGRTKTADAADRWVMPVLLLVCAGCIVALLVFVAKK